MPRIYRIESGLIHRDNFNAPEFSSPLPVGYRVINPGQHPPGDDIAPPFPHIRIVQGSLYFDNVGDNDPRMIELVAEPRDSCVVQVDVTMPTTQFVRPFWAAIYSRGWGDSGGISVRLTYYLAENPRRYTADIMRDNDVIARVTGFGTISSLRRIKFVDQGSAQFLYLDSPTGIGAGANDMVYTDRSGRVRIAADSEMSTGSGVDVMFDNLVVTKSNYITIRGVPSGARAVLVTSGLTLTEVERNGIITLDVRGVFFPVNDIQLFTRTGQLTINHSNGIYGGDVFLYRPDMRLDPLFESHYLNPDLRNVDGIDDIVTAAEQQIFAYYNNNLDIGAPGFEEAMKTAIASQAYYIWQEPNARISTESVGDRSYTYKPYTRLCAEARDALRPYDKTPRNPLFLK